MSKDAKLWGLKYLAGIRSLCELIKEKAYADYEKHTVAVGGVFGRLSGIIQHGFCVFIMS